MGRRIGRSRGVSEEGARISRGVQRSLRRVGNKKSSREDHGNLREPTIIHKGLRDLFQYYYESFKKVSAGSGNSRCLREWFLVDVVGVSGRF